VNRRSAKAHDGAASQLPESGETSGSWRGRESYRRPRGWRFETSIVLRPSLFRNSRCGKISTYGLDWRDASLLVLAGDAERASTIERGVVAIPMEDVRYRAGRLDDSSTPRSTRGVDADSVS